MTFSWLEFIANDDTSGLPSKCVFFSTLLFLFFCRLQGIGENRPKPPDNGTATDIIIIVLLLLLDTDGSRARVAQQHTIRLTVFDISGRNVAVVQ